MTDRMLRWNIGLCRIILLTLGDYLFNGSELKSVIFALSNRATLLRLNVQNSRCWRCCDLHTYFGTNQGSVSAFGTIFIAYQIIVVKLCHMATQFWVPSGSGYCQTTSSH